MSITFSFAENNPDERNFFEKHAMFLYNRRDIILNDPKMCATLVPHPNFMCRNTTLRNIINWWINSDRAKYYDKKGNILLWVFAGGIPISGNIYKARYIDKDGNIITKRRPFCSGGLWSLYLDFDKYIIDKIDKTISNEDKSLESQSSGYKLEDLIEILNHKFSYDELSIFRIKMNQCFDKLEMQLKKLDESNKQVAERISIIEKQIAYSIIHNKKATFKNHLEAYFNELANIKDEYFHVRSKKAFSIKKQLQNKEISTLEYVNAKKELNEQYIKPEIWMNKQIEKISNEIFDPQNLAFLQSIKMIHPFFEDKTCDKENGIELLKTF